MKNLTLHILTKYCAATLRVLAALFGSAVRPVV
jgi:hypothetical protein